MLDHEREVTPDWLQREQAVGYVTYVDRFAGTLAGVRERLPYLRELGVTYLHLMPLLAARPAPNDGGYAVVDYGAVEPALGTMDDLAALASDLRAAGMALCVDLVFNHVAAEHPWARDPAFLRTFPDRSEPDAYERTLPDVFPDTAPGSFSWSEEHECWVWTTFNALPVGPRLHEPGRVRGDGRRRCSASPRSASTCCAWTPRRSCGSGSAPTARTSPRSTSCCRRFRAALRIAAPAVAFKAEAIVAPRDLVPYLGTGKHEGKECDLAYHNVLMVLLWSALASGRVALMTATLLAMPPVPPGAGWLTYVRCHDDIGWAITPEDAARVGEDAYLHRRFLADFYAGEFPGTFARGARFQPDPRTGEARTSGTCASLAGLESARRRGRRRAGRAARAAPVRGRLRPRRAAADLHGRRARAVQRRLVSGRPAQGRRQPLDAPAARWTGRRPRGAHDPATIEGRLWAGLQRLIAARRATRAIHVQGVGRADLDRQRPRLRALPRAGRRAPARARQLHRRPAAGRPAGAERGFALTEAAGEVDGRPLEGYRDFIVLAPYQHLWLSG